MATEQITGTFTNGVTLSGTVLYADPVTITSTGDISGTTAVIAEDARGIQNDGRIAGSTIGVDLQAGGSVTNTIGGTIYGHDFGIEASASATIVNNGHISAFDTAICMDGGGSVTNAAGATIHTFHDEALCLEGNTTVDNSGTIIAENDGWGIVLEDGGAVTNHAGGLISGYLIGIEAGGSGIAIDNTGTIEANGTTVGYGVWLHEGGSVTNRSGGTITGYKLGVRLDDIGTITNLGTIDGTHSAGILLNEGGTVFNGVGGQIIGHGTLAAIYADDLGNGSSTVENAGTITGVGTKAVDLEGTISNRVIVDAGAVFNGTVKTNAVADNTLELAAGGSSGAISGLGAKYLNFDTVKIDTGATWTVGGTIAGFNGTTVAGFDAGDRLDLTDLSFAAGDTVTYDDGTDMLVVKDSGGGTLASIHMTGDFTGEFFKLADDGHGGSYITEDGTPCYCRGTRILTDKGEIAVEALAVGDRLITASGEARPIRWIGMRAYSGRFASGNKDVLPVLIRQGALGENIPRRDLWVSPLHAMYLDDVLIPASALVNGTSIIQAKRVNDVEYFHLELETHDIIIAEGAQSESFIDDDSRGMFHNAADYRGRYPDAARQPAKFCAPRVEDGFALEAVRDRLNARAKFLDWARAA